MLFVKSAQYGRMEIGRCVKSQQFGIGCSNDATREVERACAGKASCELTVSNQLRVEVDDACEQELAGYALIDYDCIDGTYNRVRELVNPPT